MIHHGKYQNALCALQSILVRARWMAHEAKAEQLAQLLDAAEVLPKYIAEPDDMTDTYRATVEEIAQAHNWAAPLERFDEECICAW